MSLQPDATPVFTSVVTDATVDTAPSFTTPSTENSGLAPVFTGYPGPVGYSPSNNFHSKSSVNAGAIAGGVVGGLAVVAIAVVMLYWIRRRYPKVRHVETEVVSAPPHYDMPRSDVSGVAQPAHVGTEEQPAYVYKSEGLGAKEDIQAGTGEKHVELWPVDKKI